jgi:predicted ATP-grasp superfamily ATP-dependent carboligase
VTEQPSGFLIVGGSGSHLPFVDSARRLGLYVVVVDRDPEAPAGRIADRFVPMSTHDHEAILELAHTLDSEYGLAGILTYASDAKALESVARVRSSLGLPGYSEDLVHLTMNKAEMKRALRSVGAPTPEGVVATKESEAVEFARSVPGPVLLKPAHGTVGSLGVARVDDAHEVPAAFATAAAHSVDSKVVVEAYLDGDEVSVNGIAVGDEPHLLAVCRKRNLGPTRNFIISGFWTLDPESEPAAAASGLVLDTARKLGIRDSFFAADVLVVDGRPTLLEIGLLLDAKIDRLLDFSGRGVYEAAFRVTTGAPVGELMPCPSGFALRFLFGPEPDRMGVPAATSPWSVEWERGAGHFPPSSLADTFGWVLCRGDDSKAAYDMAGEIAARCGATLFDDSEGQTGEEG